MILNHLLKACRPATPNYLFLFDADLHNVGVTQFIDTANSIPLTIRFNQAQTGGYGIVNDSTYGKVYRFNNSVSFFNNTNPLNNFSNGNFIIEIDCLSWQANKVALVGTGNAAELATKKGVLFNIENQTKQLQLFATNGTEVHPNWRLNAYHNIAQMSTSRLLKYTFVKIGLTIQTYINGAWQYTDTLAGQTTGDSDLTIGDVNSAYSNAKYALYGYIKRLAIEKI